MLSISIWNRSSSTQSIGIAGDASGGDWVYVDHDLGGTRYSHLKQITEGRLFHQHAASGSIATAVSFHSNFADQNQMIHFLKNVMMAGGLLQIVAFGAGALSIDNRSAKGG
jgi:hypothetical protein